MSKIFNYNTIYKNNECNICNGFGYIIITDKLKKKERKESCFHCNGKGYLKILKSDYDN